MAGCSAPAPACCRARLGLCAWARNRSRRAPAGREVQRVSWRLLRLGAQRQREDKIGIAHRRVATDATGGEGGVLAEGLQVRAEPATPTPAARGGVFLAVLDHELDLLERTGLDRAAGGGLLEPGDLREHGAIRPRVDLPALHR